MSGSATRSGDAACFQITLNSLVCIELAYILQYLRHCWKFLCTSQNLLNPIFAITYFYSPGVATVEPASPCGGRCQRCGLPVRLSTLPLSRSSAPAFTGRPSPTGIRPFDVTSGARRDSKDNKKLAAGVATCGDDPGCTAAATAAAAAKKRVRFASPTDDVSRDVTDDVSRQMEPVSPPPPPPPSSSFIKMPPIGRSQLRPSRMTTFMGPTRDASIV